jgi:hypothetical protein
MLAFRALALTRSGSRVWPWDICAVYYAHSDDSGGNWRPPARTRSARPGQVSGAPASGGGGCRGEASAADHGEVAAPATGYEKCRGGEMVELFGSGLVTWMFTEEPEP